jgi:hypothetical protein
MRNADFRNGIYDTGFVERVMTSDNSSSSRRRRAARVASNALSSVDLSRCRLYGILDLGYVAPADARASRAELIAGGVDIIQLRAKNLGPRRGTPRRSEAAADHIGGQLSRSVINDHAEVAREVAVEGIHVGQDDRSIANVREIAGRDCFVGKSTTALRKPNAPQPRVPITLAGARFSQRRQSPITCRSARRRRSRSPKGEGADLLHRWH